MIGIGIGFQNHQRELIPNQVMEIGYKLSNELTYSETYRWIEVPVKPNTKYSLTINGGWGYNTIAKPSNVSYVGGVKTGTNMFTTNEDNILHIYVRKTSLENLGEDIYTTKDVGLVLTEYVVIEVVLEDGAYRVSDGAKIAYGAKRSKDFIPIISNSTYEMTTYPSSIKVVYMFWYDEKKVLINYSNLSLSTAPPDAKFLTLRIDDVDVERMTLEKV